MHWRVEVGSRAQRRVFSLSQGGDEVDSRPLDTKVESGFKSQFHLVRSEERRVGKEAKAKMWEAQRLAGSGAPGDTQGAMEVDTHHGHVSQTGTLTPQTIRPL